LEKENGLSSMIRQQVLKDYKQLQGEKFASMMVDILGCELAIYTV
jgi:hypothetical protein